MVTIIKVILDVVKGFLDQKKEEQKARHDVRLSALKNRARLALNEQEFNHEWEMASLEDKDKFLRVFSFCLFSAPFIVAIFFPEEVATYFKESIRHVPLWWQQTYVAITGGVWGLSSLKNTIPGLMAGIASAKRPKLPEIELK